LLVIAIKININIKKREVSVRMKNTKILVVDDASFMRTLLGNTLKDIGYSAVEFAQDAYEAVEKAKDLKPDFVTLDISMEGMDGIQAIEKILEVSSRSKIIMVSALNSQQIINRAIECGAVDYIPKPFSRFDVETSLKRHIGIN